MSANSLRLQLFGTSFARLCRASEEFRLCRGLRALRTRQTLTNAADVNSFSKQKLWDPRWDWGAITSIEGSQQRANLRQSQAGWELCVPGSGARRLSSGPGRKAKEPRDARDLIKAAKNGMGTLGKVTVPELRNILKSLGKSVSGTRAQLLGRLAESEPMLARALESKETSDVKLQRVPIVPGIRKDLLTGSELSDVHAAVARANDNFYNAYESGDIEAMKKVWGRAGHVKCGLPGRNMVIGYESVMTSWHEIFENMNNPDAGPRTRIDVAEVRIVVNGPCSWVTCVETLEQGPDYEPLHIGAVSIFALFGSQWAMVCYKADRIIVGVPA